MAVQLIVGGVSQGGAMAQELLHLPIADRIQGIICIGTRLVRPMELRMHGGIREKADVWTMVSEMSECRWKTALLLQVCLRRLVGR